MAAFLKRMAWIAAAPTGVAMRHTALLEQEQSKMLRSLLAEFGVLIP
ncbi:MAG: hypothetical protein P8Q92_09945 [Pseudoprimorskyibacter sp.]|nr:hypothetical protein [Pseudoprimorskyibacter sp.]